MCYGMTGEKNNGVARESFPDRPRPRLLAHRIFLSGSFILWTVSGALAVREQAGKLCC